MENLSGKLLIAAPGLTDSIFRRSVVLLINHCEVHGARGFLVNGRQLGEIKSEDVDGSPLAVADGAPIFFGGPVPLPGLMLIHGHPKCKDAFDPELFTPGEGWESIEAIEEGFDAEPVVEIANGVWFGTPETYLKVLETVSEEKERHVRFIAGEAAWEPGQLESEIENGVWQIHEADPALIFDSGAWDKLNPSQWDRWNDRSLN